MRGMENISEASVQSDSQREAMFETPASDSDSGDSLFLTQSVTSPSRTVKRHRPSNTQACPFSQQLEDEQETDDDPNAQHEDASSSDSEPSYADLLRRWKSPVKRHGRIRHRSKCPTRMELPFLKTSGSGLLSVRQNNTLVSSEIGGFFKCILKLSKGHGERRRELSPTFLDSEWELNYMAKNEDDDEDIRKVNTDYFVLSAYKKKTRQKWLRSLKWKTRQAPRKCTEKSNKCQEEQEKCNQTRRDAEDLTQPQDDTDIHNDISSLNIEDSQSRKRGERSRKSPARSSLTSCSSPFHVSPDKSPFVQSLFMNHQEEHSENQPQVLVTCSQSQSLDLHQAHKIHKACENFMEPIDEMAVAETQWPSSAEQDEDETQILDNTTDRGEHAVCLEHISFREHQVQDEDIRESEHNGPVDNEDLGSVSGGFISSQDLFQEPNNQASPTEDRFENNNEVVAESGVLLHHDVDSIKKEKKRSSLIFDLKADYVTYSKSQRTQPTNTISPTAVDICQERKEKDDIVEHVYPSLSVEDTSGSRGNDFSSPSKDTLMVRQEEKTETPLFVYGGLKFLKRKKAKKTEAPEISDNPALIQGDLDQSEGFGIKQKKSKKVKIDGLLEEPGEILPEISVVADPGLSFQDSSMVSASVDGSKPKKKRKKDKHGQPVAQEDKWNGEEEDIQIPCQGSASWATMADETIQLTRTDPSSPSHELKQLDSSTQVKKDLVQADGFEQRRKKKKEVKKRDSSLLISDNASQCSEESHANQGTKTVKKKKQKFINDVGEGQAGEMATAHSNFGESLDQILEIPAGIEIQPMNSVDLKPNDSATPRNKKKKKRKEVVREENVDIEALLVETTGQVGTPDTFQDSEQQAAEVLPVRKVKKQKKKRDRTETYQEEEASKNAPVSFGFGLGDMTTFNTPSTRCETEGIGEEEGLGGSEPLKKKKKKKKRKELENDVPWLVSHGLIYSYNTEQTTVVEEVSNSGQKLGKAVHAPCLEMQLTNDANEEKKPEGIKGDSSECSQKILQSEDAIQPKGKKKKKKKKRLVETDIEVYPIIVEHESGCPPETSEAIIEKKKKKKKKNRKDIVDRGENESLDVLPDLNAAEESRHVLVTCSTKQDSVPFSGNELLVNIKKKKKKKRVRDADNDLEATIGAEQS